MSEPTPLTLLCGFLGAGKTTLLRHLLAQNEGQRWALVVNDVGALNIDASLVSDLVRGGAGDGGPELVELTNGCVCCSSKDDLAETLCRLGASGRFDHLLVETTGVAEPAALARLCLSRNPFGRSVSDFARIHSLVTVVDAPDLLRRLGGRDGQPSAPGSPKPLVELLLEQAECADLLLLNKCDKCDEQGLRRLEQVLAGLNPGAELLRTEHSQAPLEWVLGRARFSEAGTLAAARWIKDLNQAAPMPPGRTAAGAPGRPTPRAERVTPTHTASYGLTSFLFQARRPFNRDRLDALLAEGLPGIVRAKGFCWLEDRPDEMAFLSLAGGDWALAWLNPWWATMVERGRVSLDERPPMIRALWQEPHGDRRQELVLIGAGHDEAALRRRLEACLHQARLRPRSSLPEARGAERQNSTVAPPPSLG